MMIHEVKAQYMLCVLVVACLDSKNELVLSLYSLNSKTSRYAHFGHNQIAAYGHPVSRLMLPLQPQFWISEHPVCRFVKSGLPLVLRSLLPNNWISVCQDPVSRLRRWNIFQFYSLAPKLYKTVLWPKIF